MPVFISPLFSPTSDISAKPTNTPCRRNRTIPGQKAHIFARFCDASTTVAYQICAEDLGVPLDDVPHAEYLYKKNQTLSRHGQNMAIPCVSAVQGWQFRKDLENKGQTKSARSKMMLWKPF